MVKCLLRTLPINLNIEMKAKTKKRLFYITAIFFFVFFMLAIFTMAFLGKFLSPQDNLDKSDVIIVISGGETIERTAEGVKLFKQGYASYLLFSGAAKSGTVSNAKGMKNYAIKQGVSSNNILLEEKSTSTYENALFSKNILEKNNFKKIILVTSPYHQKRAYMNFSFILGRDYNIINHSSSDSNWNSDKWWDNKKSVNITMSEFVRVMYLAITKNYALKND
ncbi:hypothetical protein COX95_03315 [bacterium CG_4_10_14_0_2_um_filter_33_32]|nr:MAG: hypothetical protein AUJ93_04975 [bacterium CG2_30_33_46]PIR67557.1 MAG: hypothetical protein COU50_02915 [bacterium CG10_big_fil_rev_8_21_14_0_10_33_18]PIU77041.1 MAG: hypothetical protein COS74_00770 [bacterium CG06_land_8_20_14_3_00_33_50]PIW81388.1 MAG: hypothetical protein COZ97_01990 [bacterium CG_4_8_14_3_um_filter_33_28]PIY85343.1 MAG: hypothetical protein COY76_02745 [bacterium CG_4_10_14_0_8_um_filter_33_57]PIZ85594.1 MAG: hypothetical protein COX95_03315 [bacterium CG_4_10_1